MKQRNIKSSALPQLDGREQSEAYEYIFRWVEKEALEAHSWYIDEKRYKALASKSLRFISIILLTAGTLFPVLSLVSSGRINAEYGYIALGCAGGLLLMDRGFGFSASWTRYMVSAAKILSVMKKYQVMWALLNVETPHGDALQQKYDEAERIIREFAGEIFMVLEEETSSWISEFNSNLDRLQNEVMKRNRSDS
jgi:YD repeat-containing protein